MNPIDRRFWYEEIQYTMDVPLGLSDKFVIGKFLERFPKETEDLFIAMCLVDFLGDHGYSGMGLKEFKRIYSSLRLDPLVQLSHRLG
ncbi:MAG: hypothetical protein Q8P81_03800 [Nanoarchaeota archaeon]|nr:hypothetical protein [Nanoarchaeota archaeon]